LRSRDPAEGDRARGSFCGLHAPPYAPHQLPINREGFRRSTARQNDGVAPIQSGAWLAQAPNRKQSIARIFGGNQHNIEITQQRSVLESIVEQMHLRTKLLFREYSSLVAILPEYNRDLEAARDQQGFVAEFGSGAARLDLQNSARFAAVPARENVKWQVPCLEHLAQKNHKRSFARAAHREISDADDRPSQSSCGQKMPLIELIARSYN
jgi:hypothetical protein